MFKNILESIPVISSLEKIPGFAGKSVKSFFSGLASRFGKAIDQAKKGGTFSQKLILFFSAFVSNVNQLSEEEQKIEDEAAKKAGEVLMQMPDEQLAAAAKKELFGDKESADAAEKKVVDDVMAVSASVGKSLGAEKFGKVSKAFDKMEAGEAQIAPEEKALLAASGLKTVATLKNNPAYDTVEKFAVALGKLDSATKGNSKVQNLKQALGKSLLELDMTLLAKFSSFVTFNEYPALYELQRKVTAASLSYEEAMNLQNSIAKIFPNTKDTDRAKALMTINRIISEDRGFPTNQHIAELVFYVHTSDIEKLSEILQA